MHSVPFSILFYHRSINVCPAPLHHDYTTLYSHTPKPPAKCDLPAADQTSALPEANTALEASTEG